MLPDSRSKYLVDMKLVTHLDGNDEDDRRIRIWLLDKSVNLDNRLDLNRRFNTLRRLHAWKLRQVRDP